MARAQSRLMFGAIVTAVVAVPFWGAAAGLSPVEQLGKRLFNDTALSSPSGQACHSCHGNQVGYSGPESLVNRDTAIYPGALAGRYGNRKPPAAAYGGTVPLLTFDETTGTWSGGLFWDGRATGLRLGDPLAEQALGPFLNPLEQNNADAAAVCETVARSAYSALFESVWGAGSLDCVGDVDGTYDLIGISIAAYERSPEVSPYSSKYDAYIDGAVSLSASEAAGMALFASDAGCASCHTAEIDEAVGRPLFTNFGYANLGMPRNEDNPFYDMSAEWNPDGADWTDPGLGGALAGLGYAPEVCEPEFGKHRIPTLRNVDRRPGSGFTKAFGHNGAFKSLDQFVHYLNTRDVPGAGWLGLPWPAPEVSVNITDAVGDLGLSPDEEDALVAFLATLSDNFVI